MRLGVPLGYWFVLHPWGYIPPPHAHLQRTLHTRPPAPLLDGLQMIHLGRRWSTPAPCTPALCVRAPPAGHPPAHTFFVVSLMGTTVLGGSVLPTPPLSGVGGGGGGFGVLTSPGRPPHPPHIRKFFLWQKMKLIEGARNWRPL